MSSGRRIVIVGPSGSGKTTLAQAVARELGVPVISMDDFRAKRRAAILVAHGKEEVRTFEDPRLWDGNAIACKLRALIAQRSGFVAEGNHLLYYPEIRSLPDLELYYLDVPFQVSVARRRTRHRFSLADESFALIGESETARWVKPQTAARGIRVLDGTEHTYVTGQAIIHQIP
jgi:shikimate kinase